MVELKKDKWKLVLFDENAFLAGTSCTYFIDMRCLQQIKAEFESGCYTNQPKSLICSAYADKQVWLQGSNVMMSFDANNEVCFEFKPLNDKAFSEFKSKLSSLYAEFQTYKPDLG